MQLIDSFVRSPVKVTVGVLLVALFGYVALVRMPMQLTPEVQTARADRSKPSGPGRARRKSSRRSSSSRKSSSRASKA